MKGAKKIIGVLLICFICMNPSVLFGQNEVARERSSLRGIQSLGFTVNVETNVSLTNKDEIQVTSLQEMGEETIREGGIDLIPDKEVKQSDEIPFLYMHINTMEAGNRLVPFSITLYFYQPVKLTLNRDLQTTAATWESGTLGIVSYNKMDMISNAAKGLLQEFIADYNDMNNSTRN